MNEKISKNDLKNLIKLGYDLDLIVLEFDVPLNILNHFLIFFHSYLFSIL